LSLSCHREDCTALKGNVGVSDQVYCRINTDHAVNALLSST